MSTPSPSRHPLPEVHSPHLGTAEHYGWLHALVCCVLVLNLLDAVFTLLWVTAGVATEANPMMDDLLRGHPVLFVAGKVGLVTAGSYLLWQWRDRALAVVAIFVAFLAYYAILLVHVDYLGRVLSVA